MAKVHGAGGKFVTTTQPSGNSSQDAAALARQKAAQARYAKKRKKSVVK
jgi:hypothetical protein